MVFEKVSRDDGVEDDRKIPFAQAIRRDSTQLELPRDRRWLEPLLTFLGKRCRQNGVRQDLLQVRLSLACREAIEQSLRRHPPSKVPLNVELVFEPGSCSLGIRDDRPWVEPTRLADSTESLANPDRRRLNLIRTLVDDFEVSDHGLTLRLCIRRGNATEPLRPSVLPFVNPVEVFPLQFDGCIDYDMAYQAVFRDVTDAGITLLQQNVMIPKKACIGVYSGGRLFFLPVQLHRETELRPGMKEAVFEYAAGALKDMPRPRLDAPFAEAQVVESVQAIVADVGAQRPPQHRRAHERVLLSDRHVRLREGPADAPIFARDFSIGGMALITTFPLEVGQTCHAEWSVGQEVTTMPMRIVRCLPLIEDFYDVGGEFLDNGVFNAPTRNSKG